MDQFPNINIEIQNSNVYVYTMPYNYNNTERRRRNVRRFSSQANSQNISNEQSNVTSQDVSQNNMSNQSSNIDNSANSANNTNINSVQNQRSTLITPTQINNRNQSNNPPNNPPNNIANNIANNTANNTANNPINNWANHLNQYLDSSGSRNPLMNIAETLQSTFHIPVEQLHFEIIDNLPQRGSSINSLLDSTSLSLASQIMNNENDTCAICRQVYNNDDIVRKINICGHFFHSECIEQWLRNNNNCPVCRIGI